MAKQGAGRLHEWLGFVELLQLCHRAAAPSKPSRCFCSWLHVIHHKYNKGDQMSPFAGLAFHPLDGIMQVRYAEPCL